MTQSLSHPTSSRNLGQRRDAIVFSGWGWESFNVPERLSLALAYLGARVLYVEDPVSVFRRHNRRTWTTRENIRGLSPTHLSGRLDSLPLLPRLQAKFVVQQILDCARELSFADPVLFYPHGSRALHICKEFKQKGFALVHVCMDFPEPGQDRHVALSDATLVIPRSGFHMLRAEFGNKVFLIPQSSGCFADGESRVDPANAPGTAGELPKPIMGYLGSPQGRLNWNLIDELFSRRPEWHFVMFGQMPDGSPPNVQGLAWRSPRELPTVVASFDVGFMPYDCREEKNFHCVPLKLFDYFGAGLPVVSTPLVNLWQYADLIYFGDTVTELEEAICQALAEPLDSPKRERRKQVASEHAIEHSAAAVARALAGAGIWRLDP